MCRKCCKVRQFGVTISIPVARRRLLLLGLLALLVLPATSGADSIGGLKASLAALAARERSAVLQLYAIDSGLDRARDSRAAIRRSFSCRWVRSDAM